MPTVLKSGTLNLLEALGALNQCKGIALLFNHKQRDGLNLCMITPPYLLATLTDSDIPYIHNFVCVVRISEHDIVHLEISMDEGIEIIVVSL